MDKLKAEYSGELRCLGEGHRKILTVDVIGTRRDCIGEPIRLAIWNDQEDSDPARQVGLSPDTAREVAAHLLKAAQAVELAE